MSKLTALSRGRPTGEVATVSLRQCSLRVSILALELHVQKKLPGHLAACDWLVLYECREARRAALQASLAEKEAAERAGHNYKANPVPAHIHNPSIAALPEPLFTVGFVIWLTALLCSCKLQSHCIAHAQMLRGFAALCGRHLGSLHQT